MGSGGGKKGGGAEATDYRLSMHYAVCVGPVDEIVDITVSDKSVGLPAVTANGEALVDNMELFGGPKKGGGIKGKITYLLGSATQLVPAFLATKLGRTPATMTGYRNICSVFMSGEGVEGFTWSTNIPSVPPAEITVRRSPKGLSGDPMIGVDANPAHMIYECLTNTDWGSGYEAVYIDEASFLIAAQTLRDEAFGLSMIWRGATQIEAFVNEIIQHISATLVFDLPTSTWSLTLLRGDYDSTLLKEINPRNASLLSFQRRSWGETVNEVIVTWTNPDNEEEETVTQQDATGFRVQRTAVSDGSKNYLGIRSQEIAWRVAERELRQAGTPLAAIEVNLELSLRGLKPGDVLWFNWDELDEEGDVFLEPIIVRVLKVKEPQRGKSGFTVILVEDVFSYGQAPTAVQANLFESPSQAPVDVPHVDLMDSPFFVVARQYGDVEAQNFAYPRGHVSAFGKTGLTDTREISLFSERAIPEQSAAYVNVGTLSDLGRFTLDAALVAEKTTILTLPAGYFPDNVEVGGFLMLGEGVNEEFCVITDFTHPTITLRRGCLDTIPKAWPIGTPAWEVTRSSVVVDDTEVIAGETLDYKLLPITSLGQLSLAPATAHTITVGERLYQPLRPANVRVDSVEGFAFTLSPTATDMTVSWSNRNRFSETAQVLAWGDVTATPETGQTTEIELLRSSTVLASATGETGTSVVLDLTGVTLVSAEELTLRVWSSRDGFDSWQTGTFPVSVS